MPAIPGPRPRLATTMNDPECALTRSRALERGASLQPEYDSSNWLQTALLASPRARGLRGFVWPWVFINSVSVTWTALYMTALHKPDANLENFVFVYSLVFSTMGFLLVFRLSRAAVRFWECRTSFGNFNIGVRNFVDYLFANGKGRDTEALDDACAWACAFVVASKQFLRGLRDISADEVAGILSEEDRVRLENARHPPLYCVSMCRRALMKAFGSEKGESTSEAVRGESISRVLNSHLDYLILNEAALERLRSTKLPMIYVIHLRTFLCGYCLSMPFVFVSQWQWGTIIAVASVSFALLGIEGAATECEIPFLPDHANHLRMDQYIGACILSISSILAWDERMQSEPASLGARTANMSTASLEELVVNVDKNV